MRGLDPALTFLRHPVASLRAPRIVVDVRDEPPLVLLYPATGPRALLALLAGLGALLWLPAGMVLLSALVLACWRWGRRS